MAKHRAASMSTPVVTTSVRRAAAVGAAVALGFGMSVPAADATGLKGVRPQFAAPEPAAAAPRGQQVVDIARQYQGVPYRWGGTTPAGFDCSGFTSYVYRQVGVNLPRTSGQQAGVGTRVPASQARPGDLMWRPGHVGIYTGNGRMIHSPNSGSTVREVPVYSSSFVYIRVV